MNDEHVAVNQITSENPEVTPEHFTGHDRTRRVHHISPWWLLVIVIFTGASLRFFALDHPDEIYFDETYYANDAVVYLEGPEAFKHNLDEQFGGTSRVTEIIPMGAKPGEISWVHPPLGKWLIALGIALLGKNPWGWRSMSALFGSLTIATTYLLALTLWRRHSWAFLAALLLSLDGLAIVQSRVAMLDGFVSTFIALAFLFLACEKRRLESDAARAWAIHDRHPVVRAADVPNAGLEEFTEEDTRTEIIGNPKLQWRWLWSSKWKVLAGIAFGAAIATKWTGMWAVMTGLVLALAWAVSTRFPGRSRPRRVYAELPSIIVSLILLPAFIYVASYAGWFVSNPHGSILQEPGEAIESFVKMQLDTLHYHRTLNASHPYQSTAGTWPLMSRPIAYWYQETPDGNRGHILALGNPGIWWPFLAIVPAVLAYGLARRDWRDGLILGGYFGLYLPWFANPRTSFFYYMTPVVPFMALALVSAARRVPMTLRPAAAIVLSGLAIVGCIFYYPIWTGISITPEIWSNLMLFQSWI